jgi:hypothetical protein
LQTAVYDYPHNSHGWYVTGEAAQDGRFPTFSPGSNSLDANTIRRLHLPGMGTRWKIEFDARLPSDPDQETWKVGIASGLLEVLQKKGHVVKQARILLVSEVLSDTREIFQGWSRPGTDDCFVYAGNPGHDYRGPTIEVPPPPNMIFLVFVLRDGTIDDWNWRLLEADDPTLPQGVTGRRIWPQT